MKLPGVRKGPCPKEWRHRRRHLTWQARAQRTQAAVPPSQGSRRTKGAWAYPASCPFRAAGFRSAWREPLEKKLASRRLARVPGRAVYRDFFLRSCQDSAGADVANFAGMSPEAYWNARLANFRAGSGQRYGRRPAGPIVENAHNVYYVNLHLYVPLSAATCPV